MRLFDLEKHLNNTAVITAEKDYSYQELLVSSEKIAQEMGHRTLCFILTSNTFASISGYVGCINNHIVPVLLDSNLHIDLLKFMVECYKPTYLWMPENHEVSGGSYQSVYTQDGYTLMKSDCECPYSLNDELALLITTSGSTGSPKLVRQSYKNLLSNTESIIEYLNITSAERAITSLPMNYVYGLSVINTHLNKGASLILTDEKCHKPTFWKYFNEKQATSFAGVPFMYEMISKLNVFKNIEVPTLHTLTQAGGKLGIDLHNKFAAFAAETGRKFVVMYGASEATARMGWLPSEKAIEKSGSMGIAIPGGRFEIVNENGDLITNPDEVGELVYYGDNVTLGYAENGDDLIKGDVNNGRLVTGDMAKTDSDGFYYIVGRKKRFVKIVGKRINLDELERNLKKEFNSIDIACVGKDDNLRVFVTNEDLKKGVDEYIFHKIGVSRGLYRTNVIEEIPKNESGKILYSALAI